MKQKLTKLKGGIDKPTTMVGGFNTPFSVIEPVDKKSARIEKN